MSRLLPRYAAHLAMGLVVFCLCYGAATVFGASPGVSIVWPVNALVLAYVLTRPRSRRTVVEAILVAMAAMALANLAVGRPGLTTLGFPLANGVEIGLAVWFMRDMPMPMSRMRDLNQFLLGAVVAGPLASALVAGFVMSQAYGLTEAALIRQGGVWLLSDMIGMAVAAPAALMLFRLRTPGDLRALALPVVLGLVAFGLTYQRALPLLFAAYPMVALAVLRDRERGGALAIAAVTVALLAASEMGQGPIESLRRLEVDPIMALQVFLGCLVLSVYPMVTLVRRLDLYAAELDLRRLAAEEQDAAKSRMLGQVGEDLRSPLSGVVTVAEMLRSGRLGDLNPRQRSLLARIAEGGAEIEALTRQMIEASDGRRSLTRRVAPVAATVSAAVAGARFRAAASGVVIRATPGDPAWVADLDGERLTRLVEAGLAEAVTASPRGGLVRLTVETDGASHLRVSIEDAGRRARQRRLSDFAAAQFDDAPGGMTGDRADLRGKGGDLSLSGSDLGGCRLDLRLPRAPDRAPAIA